MSEKAASVRDRDDKPWRYNKRTPPPPPASGPPPPKGATMINETPDTEPTTPQPEPLPTTDPPLEQPDTTEDGDEEDE